MMEYSFAAVERNLLHLSLEWTLVATLLLAVLPLLIPWVQRNLGEWDERWGSFAGGMAMAYVFLHLLPELDEAHERIGDVIHLLILVGFLAYYGLEHVIHRQSAGAAAESDTARGMFSVHLTIGWIYTWLLIYAMPDQLQENGIYAVPITVALILHVLHKQYNLRQSHKPAFDAWGRYVLAAAPIAGWFADFVADAPDPLVSGVLVALLSGAMLHTVFREELPEHPKANFGAFCGGSAVYAVLVFFPKLL